MSKVVLSCWFKYRNCLPLCEKAIWCEYLSDREALERKISLRRNPLTLVMGFLFIPESSSGDTPSMNTGYIQFAEEVSLTEAGNLIGIKKMQFLVASDMSQRVTEFDFFCMHRQSMYFCIGVPHELSSVLCDDGCILSEDDADGASEMADVIQACSTHSSSISSGASPEPSYTYSELDIDNEDECSDGTEYVYENIADIMDSVSVVSSISTVSGLHGIVVVDVVDLTNDDSVQGDLPNEGSHEAVLPSELHQADLSIDGSHQVELPNELDEAQLPSNESQRGDPPIVDEVELPNELHEAELPNNEAPQGDQIVVDDAYLSNELHEAVLPNNESHRDDSRIVDDLSVDLSFRDISNILDRNVDELSWFRPNHAFCFFKVSIMLIERTPFSGTNLEGVYQERFQDTRSLRDPSYSIIDRCSSCLDPLRGQVVAHRCTCGRWNINHWICFKANFVSHLLTYQDRLRPRDYLVPCDSCRSPLFDNHSYLKIC